MSLLPIHQPLASASENPDSEAATQRTGCESQNADGSRSGHTVGWKDLETRKGAPKRGHARPENILPGTLCKVVWKPGNGNLASRGGI